MLGKNTVVAMAAVKDLAKARDFYSNALGLEQVGENPGGIMYKSGEGRIFIYPAPTAGTNQGTCATWEVTEIEQVVAKLQDQGCTFEEYDMPGGSRDGAVHTMGMMKAAWFKDPSGNILGLSEIHEN